MRGKKEEKICFNLMTFYFQIESRYVIDMYDRVLKKRTKIFK